MDLYRGTISTVDMVQDQTVGSYNWRYVRLLKFELSSPMMGHDGCFLVNNYNNHPFQFFVF